jgi:hypothetical protein
MAWCPGNVVRQDISMADSTFVIVVTTGSLALERDSGEQ